MTTRTHIRPIAWLGEHPGEALRELDADRRPVVLTEAGEARAVLMDLETWEERERAFLMLKLMAQSEADVAAGRTMSQADAFARAEAQLAAVGA